MQQHQLEVAIVGAFGIRYRQHEAFAAIQETRLQKVGAREGPDAMVDRAQQRGAAT